MKHLIVRNEDGSTEGIVPTRDDLAGIHEPQPILAVIRAKCLDCSAGSLLEVRRCTAVRCALWPYRMGKNPFSNRKGHPNAFGRKNLGTIDDGFEDDASEGE